LPKVAQIVGLRTQVLTELLVPWRLPNPTLCL
jgi:hypothetical protein